MGLGPALVVSGDEDGLQVASQGIAGLGRTPQVIGGSLGAGGSQKVPPHLLGSEASAEDGSGLRTPWGESQMACGQGGALAAEGRRGQARKPRCRRSVGRERQAHQWFVSLLLGGSSQFTRLSVWWSQAEIPSALLHAALTQSWCLSHYHTHLQTPTHVYFVIFNNFY